MESFPSCFGDKRRLRRLPFTVDQWLRICMLMRGTQVQSLLWEDPACYVATTDRIRMNYRKVSVV